MTTISEDLYFTVLQVSQYRCGYCGRGLDEKTADVDHKWPRSLGGNSDLNNLLAVCKPCLKLKDRQTVEEFRAFLFEIIAEKIDKAFDELDKVAHIIGDQNLADIETVLTNTKVVLKRKVGDRELVFFFEEAETVTLNNESVVSQ